MVIPCLIRPTGDDRHQKRGQSFAAVRKRRKRLERYAAVCSPQQGAAFGIETCESPMRRKQAFIAIEINAENINEISVGDS
jgi:hypothetical protein